MRALEIKSLTDQLHIPQWSHSLPRSTLHDIHRHKSHVPRYPSHVYLWITRARSARHSFRTESPRLTGKQQEARIHEDTVRPTVALSAGQADVCMDFASLRTIRRRIVDSQPWSQLRYGALSMSRRDPAHLIHSVPSPLRSSLLPKATAGASCGLALGKMRHTMSLRSAPGPACNHPASHAHIVQPLFCTSNDAPHTRPCRPPILSDDTIYQILPARPWALGLESPNHRPVEDEHTRSVGRWQRTHSSGTQG